ncbi:hypothetical protein RR48_02847 [Papilio machaon]|uniref:E3 ubiquitin-protein ligase APD1-4 middle domain-containing protein n=1 Tax=Papilio machaon TaxID=76193 RepID=A0A0N1IH10_PAPMA|nr:hypothetical protein RR48_02847 [Papilio machaon]
MDPQELVPLEAGLANRPRPTRQFSQLPSRACYQGPIRLCRLLVLMIVLPCMFIFIPLYMRYKVFSGQMYPMSMTDMRLIDSKISPTWCQRQVVKSNATFNAFVVPGPPSLSDELVPVSMTRELELEDDMKEYWGFYLLKGSSVTVSTCVRKQMIKGYKHLKECAYIGDNSSEELDELLEAYNLGLLSNTTLLEKVQELKKVDGKANDPGTMKRHKAGVSFHDPMQRGNMTSSDPVPSVDVTDHDPKELREILERLHAIRQAAKDEQLKYYRPPSHLMALTELHRHRDTNVDRDTRQWLSFKDIDGNVSDQEVAKNKSLEKTLHSNNTAEVKETPDIKSTTEQYEITTKINNSIETTNTIVVTEKYESPTNIKMDTENEKNQLNTDTDVSSKEIFEDVLKQLQALGDRGKKVLYKLHKTMGVDYQEKGLTPDGYAEHHSQVNETTAFDMSNSEFWSSFSSSEEALLECQGLLLNLPLTPHARCSPGDDHPEAARANALTYRVPANGYYFFVFNSENEVQRNFIRARFELQKTRYDVARTTLRECTNTTDRCDLTLDIFSAQKVVLEVPLRNNDSLWNEQFVIVSECEPRTAVYLACVIAVPILILVFAFQ